MLSSELGEGRLAPVNAVRRRGGQAFPPTWVSGGQAETLTAQRQDSARAAVGYLEPLVSAALETSIDDLDAEAAGRVLLAEELLQILTGSAELEAVRAWMRAQ